MIILAIHISKIWKKKLTEKNWYLIANNCNFTVKIFVEFRKMTIFGWEYFGNFFGEILFFSEFC